MNNIHKTNWFAKRIGVLLFLFLLCIQPVKSEAVHDYSKANADQVYKYLTETMGYSNAAACGVMANIYCESAFNPLAINSWSGAFGLCQWLGVRYNNLVNYCLEHGYNYQSITGQLHFMNHELTTYREFTSQWKLNAKMKAFPNTEAGMKQATMAWLQYYGLSGGDPSVFISSRNEGMEVIWKAYGNRLPKGVKDLSSSKCKVALASESYVYDGKVKQPAVTVTYSGKTLKAGTDYTVKYDNNKNAGTASVTVTGKGGYGNSVKKTFKITKAQQTITVKKTTVTFTSAKVTLGADAAGKISFVSANKTIAIPSGSKLKLKKAGVVAITVKAAATKNYKAATKKITLRILPSQAVISSRKNLKGGKVQLKVKSSCIPDGYQIQYTRTGTFDSNASIKEISGGKTKTVKLSGLTLKTTWKFRVRCWKVIDGRRVYGKWSPAKTLKLNK